MACNEVIAIIPARGGSKGIPRKNIRELCGKPLVAYSIETALAAKQIHRVIVSTDDEEIAEVSRRYGAEVPFLRPREMATSVSNVAEAFNYTVEKLYGWLPDDIGVVALYPTHPFRTPAMLDKIAGLHEQGYDSVITVRHLEARGNSLLRIDPAEGRLRPTLARGDVRRRDAGIRCSRPYGLASFFQFKPSKRQYLYGIRDRISLIDIDYEEDFLLAEEIVQRGLFDFGIGQ
ncbi:NTP transferase domain-containing protein [Pseudodesulfovibrio cashew]|uniref:NTP transferase domain-containing protein n=1 Tax=Pseudodesulfovibrio cashew TaxID=2678688 RepID=A0A6I6JP06_9BACT|nr:acylneuraminate cytidylyltransferase family protein [Pseudodesulfovibrio cashew]QGY39354.1 NTP transferase domain-containing protein [Pseudodesulfovibrio cashew]